MVLKQFTAQNGCVASYIKKNGYKYSEHLYKCHGRVTHITDEELYNLGNKNGTYTYSQAGNEHKISFMDMFCRCNQSCVGRQFEISKTVFVQVDFIIFANKINICRYSIRENKICRILFSEIVIEQQNGLLAKNNSSIQQYSQTIGNIPYLSVWIVSGTEKAVSNLFFRKV